MTARTVDLFPETDRQRALRESAQRSNTYRDPAPAPAAAYPSLAPVGRNADLERVYVDPAGAVLIGHYFDGCEVPFFTTPSDNPTRDLEEAREWARLRAEWDATHAYRGQEQESDEA